MGAPEELEGALMRHYKDRQFKRFLLTIARTPHYLPEKYTKGRAVVFHGYTGHSEQPSIQHLVQILKHKMGFTVSTCDFPYHGLSNDPGKESDLGKIISFRRWVYTVYVMTYKTLMLRSEKQFGVFLIGESAGALAILRFLQTYPEVQKYLAGVVILAVPLEVDQNASRWVQRHKRLLEPVFSLLAFFFPNFPVGDLPEGDRADSMEYHGKVRARTAKEIRDAVFEARRVMGKIEVPILFIHSDSDGVALPEQVEIAYRSVATPEDKKEFIIYKGVPHRVLHYAVKDIERWIEMRNQTKDWVPFHREGLLNDAVELSAIWVLAITRTLQLLLRTLLRWRKNMVALLEKILRRG